MPMHIGYRGHAVTMRTMPMTAYVSAKARFNSSSFNTKLWWTCNLLMGVGLKAGQARRKRHQGNAKCCHC